MALLADGQDDAAIPVHSHVPAAAGHGQRIGPVDRQGEVAVTLVIAPRDRSGLIAKARGAIGHRRADVDAVHRPDAGALRRVVAWCAARGLAAQASDDGYLVEAFGSAADVEAAFGARLDTYLVGRVRGRAVREEPRLPPEIRPDVLAVLGLNDLARPWRGRPQRPGGAAGAAGPATGAGYMPADIRQAYGLPEPSAGLDGRGEVAVAFEFGSTYAPADLAAFWQQARVTGPQVSRLWALGPGQAEPPAPPLGADVEATADLEWLGALAPGARLVAVNAVAAGGRATFAQALARALAAALRLEPTPAVISISYGDAEAFFAPAELCALDVLFARAAALGVTVVAASGDSGAYGVPVPVGALESVDAPACLTHVLAVGGTRLELSDGVVARELGWSNSGGAGASGGGVSGVFPTPPWQDAVRIGAATGGLSGRGVPDVCAAADPGTGYRVVLADRLEVVGGTSLAAPVWAAALTLVAQARRAGAQAPLGLAAPAVYPLAQRPARVRDILVGDNAYLSAPGYRCGPGWDAVTGVGAPASAALWQALAGPGWPQPAPPPPPEPARRASAAPPPAVAEAAAEVAGVEAAAEAGSGAPSPAAAPPPSSGSIPDDAPAPEPPARERSRSAPPSPAPVGAPAAAAPAAAAPPRRRRSRRSGEGAGPEPTPRPPTSAGPHARRAARAALGERRPAVLAAAPTRRGRDD